MFVLFIVTKSQNGGAKKWTKEQIDAEFARACHESGKHYFIPGACQGLPVSSFPGVYEACDEAIEKMSKEMF